MKLEKILKNRYVYYVAVFLMVLNVLGYVANGSMECVIIFALSTYLSNQFLTKNPTLDILVGLLVSQNEVLHRLLLIVTPYIVICQKFVILLQSL